MNIAVIGCGVMASSLVKGAERQNYFCYTPSGTKARALAQEVDGEFIGNLEDFKKKKIDMWLIGMKPQQLKNFSKDFETLELENPYIVSMLAATEIKKLQKVLNTSFVSRIMPNTPVAYGRGATLISHAGAVTNEQEKNLMTFLDKTGALYPMSEKELELATLASGCGPAFFYLFTDYLAKAIHELGLPSDLAQDLAKETFIGTASLLEKRKEEELTKLIAEVTSAKGVTIEAVNRFREKDHFQVYIEALTQAKKRSEEIGEELN